VDQKDLAEAALKQRAHPETIAGYISGKDTQSELTPELAEMLKITASARVVDLADEWDNRSNQEIMGIWIG